MSANARLDRADQSIEDLKDPQKREKALNDLRLLRHSVEELAPMIWFSFRSVTTLILEITDAYTPVFSASVTDKESDRVCNALALFETIASHRSTRQRFLDEFLPEYVYPFLQTVPSVEKNIQYIRQASLDVIASLIKCEKPEVINYLIRSDLVPICLRIMELGSKQCRVSATVIFYKIIANNEGLEFVCGSYERFEQVAITMDKMYLAVGFLPTGRLLKLIITCYLRLCDDRRAIAALRKCLPLNRLASRTIDVIIDQETRNRLMALVRRLKSNSPAEPH